MTIETSECKKRLRARMKTRRADNENRDLKEKLLIQNIFSVIKDIKDKKFFVYLSYSSEAPTDGLIESLLERSAKVYSPRVEESEMIAVEYGDDFTLSSYGIREPIGQAYAGEVDFVITPLLAVDRKGNRLGYGGGYYDKYFEKHPNALRIAYCFDFQIVDETYAEAWDKPMDYIVTDKQVIRLRNR
jgi:5-formyltetrahydrofolate cyclo-ligase